VLSYPPGSDEDAIMEAALEAGAADIVTNDDGSIDVLTGPYDMVSVKEAMLAAGLAPEQSEVTMRAAVTARWNSRMPRR
jgi:transcriptional/translational regulatory protein YebC/TACO1